MKLTVKKTRRISIVLGLIMMLTVVLASCVDLNDVPGIVDNESWVQNNSVAEESEISEEDIPTEEGHTDAPTVADIVNIEPTKVAVYGTCEENAIIRVTGGVKDAETVAHGKYYIIEVDIFDRSTLLKITAQAGEELESAAREVVAKKDATADKLLDGNSVSVGMNSLLYFDKMVTDASGDNLYTASQLNDIRAYIADTVTSYYNDRAGRQEVELIYVLVPNATTLDSSVFPEGVVKPTNSTVYTQICQTLSQTRATVIDMKSVFEALIAEDAELVKQYGGIFRETDSALSDFGAYITYREIMNRIATRFPDAAPRALDEFKWENKLSLGGNLVNYRGLDNTVITEDVVVATPNFSLDLGTNGAGSSKISSLKKFTDAEGGDYSYFIKNDANDGVNGIAERWLINDTTRTDVDLPSALIYRDYSSLSFADILTERFAKCLLGKSGELAINLSASGQYADDGDSVVDYIIVIVSEENLDTAFSLAVK